MSALRNILGSRWTRRTGRIVGLAFALWFLTVFSIVFFPFTPKKFKATAQVLSWCETSGVNMSGCVWYNLQARVMNGQIYVGGGPSLGGDLSSQISGAFANCPNAQTCKVTIINGSYTVNSSINVGSPNLVTGQGQVLEIGMGTLTVNAKINVLCNGTLQGFSREGSYIVAGGSFPSSTPVIDMGDGVNTCGMVRVQHLTVNPNCVTGSIGIRARGINESSAIWAVRVANAVTIGISIDGTVLNTQNYAVSESTTSVCTSASNGIGLEANNAEGATFIRNSFGSNGTASVGTAGMYFTGASTRFAKIIDDYCEHFQDCVKDDSNVGLAINGLNAGAGTVNTLHLTNTAGGTVSAIGIQNQGGNGTFAVVNDVTTTSVSANNPPLPFGNQIDYGWSRDNNHEFWHDSNAYHTRYAEGLMDANSTPSGIAAHSLFWSDSGSHAPKINANNTGGHFVLFGERGTGTCVTSTLAVTFGTAFGSAPQVLVSDRTTVGGVRVSTGPSTTGFTATCTGASDVFDWLAVASPN